MRNLVLIAGCLLASLFGAAYGASVLLVDSSQGSYLNKGNKQALNSASFPSLVSSVLGLLPPGEVDTDASNAVIKTSLKKARAHMVFNVAGLSQDELLELFGDKQSRELEIEGDDSPTLMFDSLASVVFSNPGITFAMLDDQGLQGCVGNCIEEHIEAAAGCMDARHANSALTFSSGANLDLSVVSDKMFASEAASLYAGLTSQLQQTSQQDSDLQLLETTLVSLHALEAAYGPDSEVVKSARAALKNLLKWSIQKLDAKYDGDVTYQASGIPKVSKKTTVKEVMGWKMESRRRLMQEPPSALASSSNSTQYPPSNQTQAAQIFTSKACGYGSFIIVLYFLLAGVWCMVYMPMKQDTMLFGAKKEN